MAYGFVQAKGTNSSGTATSITLTFDGAIAVGNKVFIQVYIAANRTFTLTENGTGTALTWRSVRRNLLGITDPLCEVFEADNVNKTGLTAVTISFTSTSGARYVTGAEYSGLKTGANVGVGFFQSNAAGTVASGTTSNMTPSAVPCALVSFAVADNSIGSRPLDTSSPTVYLTNNRVSEMTNQMRLGDTRATSAVNETVTWSWSGGNQRFGLALAAFEEAVVGPTITVQPANDVGIISNGQSTVYTATATGTNVQAPTWSEDASPIADGGIYDIVTTGAGTSSCTSTLTITRTVKTGTPFDIAANFEDDNGDTDTNTVTDTWWTGPSLTTFPATDGSGESQATLTSDYVTGVGEAIEVRIPLSDGDVAVTVTTT
jgi:hypothetical protein